MEHHTVYTSHIFWKVSLFEQFALLYLAKAIESFESNNPKNLIAWHIIVEKSPGKKGDIFQIVLFGPPTLRDEDLLW